MGTLGWWAFGWAFAYGSQGEPANGFIGTSEFFGVGLYTKVADTDVITPLASCDADGCQSKMLSWFFQWAFCTAGATIVSGGVAERVKSPTYAVYAFCMTSFIYPVVVAWTWGYGWLDSVLDVGCRAVFALGLTFRFLRGLNATCMLAAADFCCAD